MRIVWFGPAPSVDYKLAYEEQMKLAQAGIEKVGEYEAPEIDIILVPDGTDLTTLWGDDWNDAPADCNACRPYTDRLPAGSVRLHGQLGGHLEREELS